MAVKKKEPKLSLKCDRPQSLMVTTQKLLKKNKETATEINKKTSLPIYWIQQFRQGKFKSSSVNRVQTLYSYLSGKKIVL